MNIPKWRLVFVEGDTQSLLQFINTEEGRAITSLANVKNSPRMEARGSNGAQIRIGNGGEFTLIESPLGEIPQFYGEVFVSRENPGKYRTSCYVGRSPSSGSIDYFVRPVPGKNKDNYYAIVGDLVVFEFDSNGRSYDIVSIPEGHMAGVSYTSDLNPRKYSATEPKPIEDTDYDYILKNYIDPRMWR